MQDRQICALAPELNPRVTLQPHTAEDFGSAGLCSISGLSLTRAPEIDGRVGGQPYHVRLDFGQVRNLSQQENSFRPKSLACV
jgi:hypothetical protein